MPLDQVDVDKMDEDETEETEMSFLDHLEELRWHLVRSVLSIVVFGTITFLAKDFVFKSVILAPKEKTFATYKFFCSLGETFCFFPKPFDLTTIALGEQFFVHLKVSFFLGLMLSFPYIFWEIWRFIKPGLYPKERNAARGIVFICSFLFFSGVLFGYYVISPFAISFLASYNVGAVNTTTLDSFVSYMTMFTLPTGLVFELPIVVYFLAKVGLVGPSFMRQYRRHAVIVILVVASIITPPDVVTQFLIGLPLYGLYEISILIAARVEKNNQI